MSLDFSVIGSAAEPRMVSWTSTDALLYALAVGAGQDDPIADLEFTTENSKDLPQRVLPTFGTVIIQKGMVPPHVGNPAHAKGLHQSQSLTLCGPIPVEGSACITTTVKSISDWGWGAQVVYESCAVESSGRVLVTASSAVFLKDQGGFGGGPIADGPWETPDRPPDVVVELRIAPNQALLYRLCGDRNPLHSDPSYAAQCGFRQPILHGLCTYGIAGRALLRAVCGSDAGRWRTFAVRFSRRVVPGESLTVRAWCCDDEWRFRVVNAAGYVTLDRGTLTLAPPQ